MHWIFDDRKKERGGGEDGDYMINGSQPEDFIHTAPEYRDPFGCVTPSRQCGGIASMMLCVCKQDNTNNYCYCQQNMMILFG
jgi:hypothetical protein